VTGNFPGAPHRLSQAQRVNSLPSLPRCPLSVSFTCIRTSPQPILSRMLQRTTRALLEPDPSLRGKRGEKLVGSFMCPPTPHSSAPGARLQIRPPPEPEIDTLSLSHLPPLAHTPPRLLFAPRLPLPSFLRSELQPAVSLLELAGGVRQGRCRGTDRQASRRARIPAPQHLAASMEPRGFHFSID
jgi:hypothetical protein